MAGLDAAWGGSVHLNLEFKGRGRLLPGVRHLIIDVCSEYLECEDVTQQLVTAVQELVENLIKYSEAGASLLDFELRSVEGQPTVRIRTQNRASARNLAAAGVILERIIGAQDPVSLYQAMVAASGDREGSGLGLARLRAEVGLTLSYAAQTDRLSIEASRSVVPRSVVPRSVEPTSPGAASVGASSVVRGGTP
jgi:hypothetical protein